MGYNCSLVTIVKSEQQMEQLRLLKQSILARPAKTQAAECVVCVCMCACTRTRRMPSIHVCVRACAQRHKLQNA